MSNVSSKPKHVTTEHFETEVIESDLPVIVDFWAPWCGPCKAIGPVLDELSQEFAGQVKVVKVNVDDEPAVAGAFKVRGIPTLVAIKGRDVFDVQVGFGGASAIKKMFETAAKHAA